MPDYRNWNQAIAKYFTSGVPQGSRIYLNVDDDVLTHIGQNYFSGISPEGTWAEDFQLAVRRRVVAEDSIALSRLPCIDNEPPGTAFLGAMVLAAYQMADNEVDQVSEQNYFRRFREVLNLPGHGRPLGMRPGASAEEPLWHSWNLWLKRQGFQPTARPGNGGPTKFIKYAISQSLLRAGDKERLCQLFIQQNWRTQWDASTLFAQVRYRADTLTGHLREILKGDRQRFEALAQAVHEVHEQWLADGCPSDITSNRRTLTPSPHLYSGIYRIERFFEPIYYVYPKQPRGQQLEHVQVQQGSANCTLQIERSGWYTPAWEIGQRELNNGAIYSILAPTTLENLILPTRDFWILVPDIDNPDSGEYASWGVPSLGIPFIILCKKALLSDLNRLRSERLLQWSGEPIEIFHNSEWVELQNCMVLTEAWAGVFIGNQELFEALRPVVSLSINFSGGLRVPDLRAWLVSYPPQIRVSGFYPTVKVEVRQLINDEVVVMEHWRETDEPFSINLPGAGDYLVRVKAEDESVERLIRMIEWSQLAIQSSQQYESLQIVSCQVCGSVIQERG